MTGRSSFYYYYYFFKKKNRKTLWEFRLSTFVLGPAGVWNISEPHSWSCFESTASSLLMHGARAAPHLQSRHSCSSLSAPAALLAFPSLLLLLGWLTASSHSSQILPKSQDQWDVWQGLVLPTLVFPFPLLQSCTLSTVPASWPLKVPSSPKTGTAESTKTPPPYKVFTGGAQNKTSTPSRYSQVEHGTKGST